MSSTAYLLGDTKPGLFSCLSFLRRATSGKTGGCVPGANADSSCFDVCSRSICSICFAAFLSMGRFPDPHLGEWTQAGHPVSQGQSRIASYVLCIRVTALSK